MAQVEDIVSRSNQGHTVDAQACRGDEGRVKLRQATGSCKQALIRRFPNGATRQVEDLSSERMRTRRTETSKYPEEEKTIVIPQVVASERGRAQTTSYGVWGCRTCIMKTIQSRSRLESGSIEGERPVGVRSVDRRVS
eukprot:TRINITY_DN4756_c0_g2_i4.p4 TRINITY_DN4756_c0_g2~~TRINITY_DN4756_c0_g2_i4.p4  ORF type:complete len:138 (-),score=15.35 TRINITY_DN4756_c0_g2_i4:451-864(-)